MQQRYDIEAGQKRHQVAVCAGTSIGSSLARVFVDSANFDNGDGVANSSANKSAVLNALKIISERIQKEVW